MPVAGVSESGTDGVPYRADLRILPVEVSVPELPIPVKAEGQYHLGYELFITNMGGESLLLADIDIFNDEEILVSYREELSGSILTQFSEMPDGGDIREIPKGGRTVAFCWVSVDDE